MKAPLAEAPITAVVETTLSAEVSRATCFHPRLTKKCFDIFARTSGYRYLTFMINFM